VIEKLHKSKARGGRSDILRKSATHQISERQRMGAIIRRTSSHEISNNRLAARSPRDAKKPDAVRRYTGGQVMTPQGPNKSGPPTAKDGRDQQQYEMG